MNYKTIHLHVHILHIVIHKKTLTLILCLKNGQLAFQLVPFNKIWGLYA